MTSDTQRVVVVTGGSRGIGRSICIKLAAPGTKIFFNYFSPADREREEAAAAETIAIVREAGSEAVGIWANVAVQEEVAAFFDQIVSDTGRIDVLVNNAGITRDNLMARMKEADWDAVLNINLKGPFLCTQIAARAMAKQRYGRIINMASVVGVIGNVGQANYVAAKAGLIGLTKTTAKEYAARGITVNAVAPGFIDTEMTAVLPEKVKEAMLATIPLGRAGQPEDVANAVAFLASDEAAYLTGQVLHVSGGMFM
ncbi:3-oxoacyl-[acyl-carrier-protein] reductase [Desulfatitalea tepidiphila]|uniref:3-oxoacyl-[acyl-carrier-protein] reductase n=1 Tax=Desulfatitalea tepidiphila TaxID=1185843 RepID=UPI0006B56F97|nr:3-oxoacyl-[acyl-carrier-protein] reductase [Desulfatitalea tepidiphila]